MKTFEQLMAQESPKLLNCVHCGLCLDECPTYRMSGDENNSPRGRLALWRAAWEGRLDDSPMIEHYTDQCVGCMACVSACPANVPYGELLAERRALEVAQGRKPDWRLRLAAWAALRPRLFQLATLPLRWLRRRGILPHRLLFKGQPELNTTSAAYAQRVSGSLMAQGPAVGLLSGCLMEGVFREINFATIRVLAVNGYQVKVPESQACCGSMHEHAGLAGKAACDAQNQEAFKGLASVVTNSSGCGLALRAALGGVQRDVVDLLNSGELKKGAALPYDKIYVDLPCHAVHGLGLKKPASKVLDSLGVAWSLAPDADRCCGSGGAYAPTHPEESQAILKEKSEFLNAAPEKNIVLATSNHVCMQQWASAGRSGLVKRPYHTKHLIQLLDESYALAGYYASL